MSDEFYCAFGQFHFSSVSGLRERERCARHVGIECVCVKVVFGTQVWTPADGRCASRVVSLSVSCLFLFLARGLRASSSPLLVCLAAAG